MGPKGKVLTTDRFMQIKVPRVGPNEGSGQRSGSLRGEDACDVSVSVSRGLQDCSRRPRDEKQTLDVPRRAWVSGRLSEEDHHPPGQYREGGPEAGQGPVWRKATLHRI